MATSQSGSGFAASPSSVAIIGGGRWARVLICELYGVVPPAVAISIHSTHNSDSMSRWVKTQGYTAPISVSSSWPDAKVGAVIVANSARDHEAAIDWTLNMRIPTLVEKPIALTGFAAERLTRLAEACNVPLATSQVFLFARYLANFSKVVKGAGPVKSLRICWSDPAREDRYGEQKNYDASLPIFADWLPHIVPIASHLVPELQIKCPRVQVDRGGAVVQLELMTEGIRCTVRMERNAEHRQRIIEASTAGEVFQLDFSTEPGIIISRTFVACADSDWENGRRPVASMLSAFLDHAVGEPRDERLHVRHGLQACKIIDEVAIAYRSSVARWLTARLSATATMDENLQYALSELLQKDERLPTNELNRRITAVMSHFRGLDAVQRSRALSGIRDISGFLGALAV